MRERKDNINLIEALHRTTLDIHNLTITLQEKGGLSHEDVAIFHPKLMHASNLIYYLLDSTKLDIITL
jgi:hypothetical protein